MKRIEWLFKHSSFYFELNVTDSREKVITKQYPAFSLVADVLCEKTRQALILGDFYNRKSIVSKNG